MQATPRQLVNIGIAGLGSAWEAEFRPVLHKLRERIRVRAVYDPVASRAHLVAADCEAFPVKGLRTLVERDDVRAILLLDTGWHGHESLRLLCNAGKPMFVGGSLGCDPAKLRSLYDLAVSHSLTLMPDCGRRYTPASGRLQELMATRIGKPRRITIDVVAPAEDAKTTFDNDLLISLFDWCHYIVRRPPAAIKASSLPTNGDRSITLDFHPPRGSEIRATAELRVRSQHCEQAATTAAPAVRFEVECERGTAVLEGKDCITWTAESDGACETLASERSQLEVMLDFFCRRVAGGLLPVPDANDICRGALLLRAVDKSLSQGETVKLNGEFRA